MRVAVLLLRTLASMAALGLPSTQALAGTFAISPLRVELSSQAQTSALTLRNQDESPVVVQAEVLLWEQSGGEDRLTPTRDVLVSPAVFTLPGNGSQLVRVALRRPVDDRNELSYRLILTEVPQQADPDFTGLNMALRLSLPVFVAPTSPAEALLEWSIGRDADGAVLLSARNTGNAHTRILGFTATPVAGHAPVFRQGVTAYVLGGQTRTWTLDKTSQAGATSSADVDRLQVKGSTDAGDFEVETRPEAR